MANIVTTPFLNQPTDLTPIPRLGTSMMLVGIDVYNAMLYTLLITIPGTRPFFPNYGVGVSTWIFAPLDLAQLSIYNYEIRQQIAQWIPQLNVTTLKIEYLSSQNGIQIDIVYTVAQSGLLSQGSFSNIILSVK